MSKPVCSEPQILAEGKFLSMSKVDFQDSRGKRHVWEMVQRRGTNAAAIIMATLRPSGKVLLIRQFRVPLNAFAIELPAGLVDPGEDLETTAMRELVEETGYHGTIQWVSPYCGSSVGLTGELVGFVQMDVDETLPENQHPAQNLQDSEDIEVFALAPSEISAFVRKQAAQGDVIDSRVMSWMIGQNIAK